MIRPLPSRLRNANLSEKNKTNDVDGDHDDEMFLDADGELSSEVAIDTGLPIKRDGATNVQHHIIYKRKQAEDDSMSDYGNCSNFRNIVCFFAKLLKLILSFGNFSFCL